MQKRLRIANASYLDARADYEETLRLAKLPKSGTPEGAVRASVRRAQPAEPLNIAFVVLSGALASDRSEEGRGGRRACR